MAKDGELYAHRAAAPRWLIHFQEEGVLDRVLSDLMQEALK